MSESDRAGAVGRAVGNIKAVGWKARAKQAAASLKAEYEAGKQGDTAPATPIWSTPKEQFEALLALLRSSKAVSESSPSSPTTSSPTTSSPTTSSPTTSPPTTSPPTTSPPTTSPPTASSSTSDMAAEVDEVADALRTVDWARVRAATADRTSEATKAMRAMADQVDWARVQPIAAHLSSALIAAVASGQVPIGGRLGSTVAKAIADQGGLGQRVAQNLGHETASLPPDFRGAIEATSRET